MEVIPMNNDEEFAQAMYAALMKQAHDLQEQRGAVLQQAAAWKKYKLSPKIDPLTTTIIKSDANITYTINTINK